MADWPAGGNGRITSVGAVLASSYATTVTTGGTVNTKGAWVELVAATEFAASSLYMIVNNPSASTLIDVGVGAASSEQILIPDILAGTAANHPKGMLFPVRVPAGARLAARAAATTASASTGVIAYPIVEGFSGPVGRNRVVAYGTNAADSGGVSIDPGTSANTNGAWTEITPSTSAAHKGLAFAVGSAADTSLGNIRFLFDIAIGAAASEQVIIPNVLVVTTSGETINPAFTTFFPVSIPQGVRISARSQANFVTVGEKLLDVAVYGVT